MDYFLPENNRGSMSIPLTPNVSDGTNTSRVPVPVCSSGYWTGTSGNETCHDYRVRGSGHEGGTSYVVSRRSSYPNNLTSKDPGWVP